MAVIYKFGPIGALLLVALAPSIGWAQQARAAGQRAELSAGAEASSSGVPPTSEAPLGPRLHAQLELSGLVLPTAPLLGADRRPGTGGDFAMPLGFHFHYRARRFAFGVNASLAVIALTQSPYSGTDALPRRHERGFFQLAPEGRYHFMEGGRFEFWANARAGLVMLADRYGAEPGDVVPSNYGVKTTSVRSDGLELLGGVGGAWRMHRLFTLGLDLRGGGFLFPGSAGSRCNPLGDCNSMSGAYPVLELGLSFGILRDI